MHAARPGRLILAAGSMLDQAPEVVIDAAAATGFDGVGLRLSGEHATSRPADLRRRAADQGVDIFDAEVYRITEIAERPATLLDAAAAAGAEAVLVVSSVADRSATVAALHDLMAECAARGLRLGFEYMAFTYPGDPLGALAIADEVGCEVLVDVLHHTRLGAGTAELDAIIAAGRLGWAQLCDAPLAGPDGPFPHALAHEARHGRVAPGHGELPLTELIARLPRATTISVEVQSDELLAVEPIERARLLHDASRSVLAR